MTPADWLLVVDGFADQARAGTAGAEAPSQEDVDALVRLWNDQRK